MSRKGTKNPRTVLNPRQQLYVTAYLECLEGKLAAELAGYSKKSACDISKQLQRHPVVRAAIDRGLEERERELKDHCVRAMEHTLNQATVDFTDFFNPETGELLDPAKMPRATRRAIASFEVEFEETRIHHADGTMTLRRIPRLVKVRLHDKRASQELFAKYAGKLKDSIDLRLVDTLEQLVPKRKAEGE